MRSPAAVLAACVALGLGACGDDDEPTTGGDPEPTTTNTSTNQGGPPITNTTGEPAPSTVELAADPDGALAYEPTELTAEAFSATIEFTNESGIDHDVTVEDANDNVIAQSDVIRQGTFEVDVEAESDVYAYYCSVGSHREAGMEGTLTLVDN